MLSRLDELTIGADAAEARRASDWLEATCQQRGVPEPQAARLVLCLDEALMNVITHGCKATPAEPISLVVEVRLGHDFAEAMVTVSDACVAFDPLSVPAKGLPKTLDEAKPGGMGLEIIRRCSDLLRYRHEGGRNHLTFGTRWNSQ